MTNPVVYKLWAVMCNSGSCALLNRGGVPDLYVTKAEAEADPFIAECDEVVEVTVEVVTPESQRTLVKTPGAVTLSAWLEDAKAKLARYQKFLDGIADNDGPMTATRLVVMEFLRTESLK